MSLTEECKKSSGIWDLREEARKSWDHVVSDEVVCLAEPISRNRKVPHFFLSKKYLKGDSWFELHITCAEDVYRELHFKLIIDIANVFCPARKRKVKNKSGWN